MKWTVIWIAESESELAQLWMDAVDRAEITRAAERIDQELGNDPLNTGESRAADERIGFMPPLAVEFTVDQQERRVYVYHVRGYPKR